MGQGTREGPRGDLHHAIREWDSVCVGQAHPQAGAGPEDPELLKGEPFPAVAIRMAWAFGGCVVL